MNHLNGLKSKAESSLRKKFHLWTVASTYAPKFPAHPSRRCGLQISDSSSWSHRHIKQQNLHQFSTNALTNYYKRVAHSNRNFFSHRSEGWKTKMSTGWHSLQRLLGGSAPILFQYWWLHTFFGLWPHYPILCFYCPIVSSFSLSSLCVISKLLLLLPYKDTFD